jgi:hypothetical protein
MLTSAAGRAQRVLRGCLLARGSALSHPCVAQQFWLAINSTHLSSCFTGCTLQGGGFYCATKSAVKTLVEGLRQVRGRGCVRRGGWVGGEVHTAVHVRHQTWLLYEAAEVVSTRGSLNHMVEKQANM